MGLKINLGSGQRQFGLPRRIPQHNQACAYCGVSAEFHTIPRCADPPYHPSRYDHGHEYIPLAADAWVNVDINPRWNPDIVADGAHMPMFEDGSADLIVSHHNLEHYGCGDASPMLHECHRILGDGGSLIICVPDMRALTHGWLQGRISTQVYMTNVYGAYMNDEADRHKWGFDEASLREFLLSCGFSRIARFGWREIPGAEIARDWWILGMEAHK